MGSIVSLVVFVHDHGCNRSISHHSVCISVHLPHHCVGVGRPESIVLFHFFKVFPNRDACDSPVNTSLTNGPVSVLDSHERTSQNTTD